jgi:hypothetical protein
MSKQIDRPTPDVFAVFAKVSAVAGSELEPPTLTRSLDEIRADFRNIPHIVEHGGLFQERVKPMFSEYVEVTYEELDDLAARTKARIAEIGQSCKLDDGPH